MREPNHTAEGVHPSYYLVLCTVPDADSGIELARGLVERKLVACVNRVPGLVSVYRWDGKIRQDDEELLLIKTDEEHLSRVVAAIEDDHPYDCPEAIAIPVSGGSLPYLNWIRECLD